MAMNFNSVEQKMFLMDLKLFKGPNYNAHMGIKFKFGSVEQK